MDLAEKTAYLAARNVSLSGRDMWFGRLHNLFYGSRTVSGMPAPEGPISYTLFVHSLDNNTHDSLLRQLWHASSRADFQGKELNKLMYMVK